MILVLDLDGVVITGHPEGGRWDKDLARDLGIKAETLQTRFFRPHFSKIVVGEADLFETLDRVWPELECEAQPRALVDYWFSRDSRIDPEVLALVDAWRAKGERAFLATVQEHHRARHVWETLGLSQRFDGILYSAALGATKPDAEFFRRAQEKLPVVTADEIVFLDDNVPNVEGAAALGWRAHRHRGVEDLRAALRGQKSPSP